MTAAARGREADPVAVPPHAGVVVEVGGPVPGAGSVTGRSPQKPTGIDGIGAVITSSPSSSTTGSPCSSKACAATPRQGPEISPLHTGCSGLPCTMPGADVRAAAAHVEQHRRARTARGPSGSPRRAAGCRPRRSAGSGTGRGPWPGSGPALRQAMRNPGLAPISVAPVCSASAPLPVAGPGTAGCRRSARSTRRTSSAETSAFHIIQAVVVNHSIRSPGARSQCRPWFFRCSEQDAAVAVHDRLRLPGGAGGEQHAQRVVERHRLERRARRVRRSSSAQPTTSGSSCAP